MARPRWSTGCCKQSHIFRDNQVVIERVMDSNDLERERGITILAKNTAVTYKGHKINIVDTPGHADFGGEVERVMNMVDGVLLLVDAVDGPMPQTRFVLRKALEMGHKAIVVINKVDRPNARLNHVANATFDLFIDLGATDDQAEFPIVYTNAILGHATLAAGRGRRGLAAAVRYDRELSPAPEDRAGCADANAGQHAGLRRLQRPHRHRALVRRQGPPGARSGPHRHRWHDLSPARSRRCLCISGLQRIEVEEAEAGEIVAVTGLPEIFIGETIADPIDPIAAAAHPRGRADGAHDVRRQHQPAHRQGRHVEHVAQAARAPVQRTGITTCRCAWQETEQRRYVHRLRARRIAPGDPDRDDAARRLRISSGQAAK